MSTFADPATSVGIKWADLLGRLLLIEPTAYETDIDTAFGVSSAVRADVAVLDGDDKGETFDDTLIFPKALQGNLRSRVGEKVLGRLTQGAAKPGQSPPWLLEAATDADREVGQRYLDHVAGKATTAPAAATATPEPVAAGTEVPF